MTPNDLPVCERTPCEIWSRCMGYHRPVSWWNTGKRQEHKDRKLFLETRAMRRLPA